MSSISFRTESRLKQKEEAEAVSLFQKLPEEINNEMFLKLPGKSILSCRCVCKFFYNLLSSPSFIKNHLNIHSKRNPKLLCFHRSWKYKPLVIYSIPIDYASIFSSSCDGAVLLNYPFESDKSHNHSILGSCDGLVCLKILSFDRSIENEWGEYLQTCYYTILNPLTGEYKEFLGPNHGSRPRHPNCEVTYGFGYDSKLDDYKLVIISDFETAGCFEIDVYAMKSDSWKHIQGTINYSFLYGGQRSRLSLGHRRSHGVFFNGRLHWLGFLGSKATQGTSSQVIICFDVSNEKMLDMRLLEDIFIPSGNFRVEMHMNMGVWGDCICVTCVWGTIKTEVWAMQEYGVKESCIKIWSRPTPGLLLGTLVPYLQPLWCFHNGEVLVNDCSEKLLLYDPTNDTIRSVRPAVVQDVSMDENREIYVESLVSLGSGTYLEKQITHSIVKNLK